MANIRVMVGDDEFRRKEKLKFYKLKFAEKFPQGVIDIFSLDTVWQKVNQACLSAGGLFGTKSLVILDDFWNPDTFELATKADFFNIIKDEDNLTLLISQKSLPKNTKYGKFLHKFDLELYKTDKFNFAGYAKDKIRSKEMTFAAGAVDLLLQLVGKSTARIASELDKLQTYANGSEITKKDITNLINPRPDAEIWDAMDAFRSGNAKKAITMYRRLRNLGQSGYEVLPMMIREALLLSQIKSSIDNKKSASAFGLHPFVVSKSQSLAQKVTMKKLEWLVNQLMSLDFGSKTGEISTHSGDETELDIAIETLMMKWQKLLKT